MKKENLLALTKKSLMIATIIPTSLFLTSCQTYHKNKKSMDAWLLEEFGEYQTPKHDAKKFHSTNTKDYIHSDGWATAIPSTEAWDLYISPYAPEKYIRSKEAPGSKVVCPYTGKPLLLGDRTEINELLPK